MSFLTSMISTQAKSVHDGAIRLMAQWNPEAVSAAQLDEWNTQARDMAQTAAKAAEDAKTAQDAVANLKANVARYTAAAEKLAATNEEAANKSADLALEYSEKLEAAQTEANEATAWAKETHDAAEKAQRLVMEGRTKIEKAKRDQAHALQEAKVAEQRRADRERMAGITTGLSGTDAAIDAMAANARTAREKAAADNLRSSVLGKAQEADTAIQAALAEVDGGSKPQSLADKLAALKSKG
jgi:hypothetical protein